MDEFHARRPARAHESESEFRQPPRRPAPTNTNANAAGDLDNNLTFRNNALAAGLPANFFVVNPHADQVNVRDSGAFSTYHALQLELRRRLSHGLSFNGSYQYALEEGSEFLGFHFGRVGDPANASIRHAIKTQWDWTIPVGRDQRFGRTSPACSKRSSAAGNSMAPAASRQTHHEFRQRATGRA